MFGIKKAGNLVFASSGKLSSALNEMFRHVLLSETNQNEIMMSSSLGGLKIAPCIGKHGTFHLLYAWFSLKRLGIWSCAYWYTFRSKTKV